MTHTDPPHSLLSLLTAGIAHDYNNILSILNGYLHILSQSHSDDIDLQQKLQAMRKATQRAEALNTALLTLSPVHQTNDCCDLVQTINDSLILIHTLLGSRIDLWVNLPVDKIIVQTSRIQIIETLLSKIAVQKSDPDLTSVTLTVTLQSSNASVTINDAQALLFNLHHENNPFADKTVLVVDDEEELLPILEHHLHGMGLTVLKAANADTALLLQKDYPDVIDFLLTDIVMPDLDGIELAEKISDDRPRMGVIYMTGYGLTADIPDNSLILPKPLDPATLSHALQQALEKVQDA